MTHASDFGFQVPGNPRHVVEARGHLAAVLSEAGVPAELVEAAVVAGSELVTNAVLHSASGLVGGKVTVHTTTLAACGWTQVDVCDQGPIPAGSTLSPFQAKANDRDRFDGESGRGLDVVAGLSAETGAYDSPDGHVAWFRLTWPISEMKGSHHDG